MGLSPETLAKLASLQQEVNLDDNPLLSDMPEWFRGYRGQQGDIIRDIIGAFRAYDVVVLDAPTGTGKTVIGETVRRLNQGRAIYLCSSLSLQDQFLRDYPYAKVLKGRSNYRPLLDLGTLKVQADNSSHRQMGLPDCSDCTYDKTSHSCLWCSQFARCPYQVAKVRALSSPISVLNTSYFLTETNGPGRFMASKPSIVIVDECDCLEKELMNYVSVSISKSRLAKLGISGPEKITVQSSWEAWLENTAIPVVRSKLKAMEGNRKKTLASLREQRGLFRLVEGLASVQAGLESGGWIYTGDRERVEFKPVLVDQIGYEKFWKHLEDVKVLCMSASVINSERMLRDTGYTGKYAEFKLASTFPVENRLVKVWPVANMSKKANERGSLLAATQKIVDNHPEDRILMHTVSYDLAGAVYGFLWGDYDRPAFTYNSAQDRADALQSFLDTPKSILVASSMDRGIDLPDDLCRVQVICKVPFPYLGDRQVAARLYARGGSEWYACQTVRTLVQMTGRGVRHSEDWCHTYILDSQFWDNVWERNKWLFPKWWRDSVILVGGIETV